jgi:dipeptidyl-peptidase-3
LNTRLFKTPQGYQVLIASADPIDTLVETFQLDDSTQVQVTKGDFSREMALIASHIESALPFAANDNQKDMLEAYYKSFLTGSIEAHKDSQKAWIKDIGPVVETNIGFIETYRDPAGVRAEWEGFVAVVNKEMTKKFGALVNAAEKFIPKLPWGKDFEKDTFSKPDFTSLEVLTFATSGSPPAGMYFPPVLELFQERPLIKHN